MKNSLYSLEMDIVSIYNLVSQEGMKLRQAGMRAELIYAKVTWAVQMFQRVTLVHGIDDIM